MPALRSASPDIRMAFNSESLYRNRRTYVVKMRSDAGTGKFAGRFENVLTGREHEFSSGLEFVELMTADLEDGNEKSEE